MPSEGAITAATDIDIVNAALLNLGQTTISQFGQNIGTGRVEQASYNMSRDDLLRRQPWNFARKWASLALLTEVPVGLDFMPETAGSPGLVQFTRAFALPIDAIRIFRFSPKDAHWRIIGKALYTDATPPTTTAPLLGLQPLGNNGTDNQPSSATTIGPPLSVGIEYIRQETDPNMWDASFRQCFVFKLMKEMAMGITGLNQAYMIAKGEYDDAMAQAAAINGIENWPDEYWNTDLTTPRYGYIGVTIQGY